MALPNPIDHRCFEQEDGSLAIKWTTSLNNLWSCKACKNTTYVNEVFEEAEDKYINDYKSDDENIFHRSDNSADNEIDDILEDRRIVYINVNIFYKQFSC